MWNTLHRFQGRLDSPLTDGGIEQADTVADLLLSEISTSRQAFRIDVSPLGRARQTAERIRRVLPQIAREEPRLAEVSAGTWDGMTKFEIDNEFPGMLDDADAFDWYFRSPDGESFDAACARARARLADTYSPTIAISHGLFGRLIRGVYSGLSRREMLELPVPQDGFYHLRSGEFVLVSASTADVLS